MSKLDRKRPFGQVYGPANHAYEQDGKQYDHEGEEVLTDEQKAARAAEEAASKVNPMETLLQGSTAVISEALPGLTSEQVQELVVLETAGKARKGVLAALEEDLAGRKPAGDQLDDQLQD